MTTLEFRPWLHYSPKSSSRTPHKAGMSPQTADLPWFIPPCIEDHRGHHLTRNLFHLYRKWMTMVVGLSEPCRWRNKAQHKRCEKSTRLESRLHFVLEMFSPDRTQVRSRSIGEKESGCPNNPRTDRTANCRASSCSAVVKCQGDIWILRS